MTTAPDDISLPEGACLGLVAAGCRHGWAVARELASDGDLGRIWTLSRPLTYRAINQLVDRDLLVPAGTQTGPGPQRTLLAITPSGRRALKRWIHSPARHLRDIRTEFLVKVCLARRLGYDDSALIDAQREELEPIIEALAHPSPSEDPVGHLIALWRHESSQAVRRFLDTAQGDCD